MKTEPSERARRAVDEIRRGRMVILVDDEDRENEGDLVMAAQCVTPESINFMAKFARGLICLSLSEERIAALQIPMMVEANTSSFGTAFTVSIEARSGVTTGISAADRARTIRVAMDAATKPEDLVRPGHVFPLRARKGGVLVRTGQTEGSVDLARLAGLEPAGVICEIMNDDGSMARRPDLDKFAADHGLLVCSVADLIEYRLRHDRLVTRQRAFKIEHPRYGACTAHVYGTEVDHEQHLALVFGELQKDAPVLARVQTECRGAFGDLLGGCTHTLDLALSRLAKEGGVFVGICQSHGAAPSLLSELEQPAGDPAALANRPPMALREFGIGAQILRDLGLHEIRVLTNHPRRLPGIEAYGLAITETVQIGPESPRAVVTPL